MNAGEVILQKALVASGLDSREWNGVQSGLRNRAFFSSQVAQANILAALRVGSAANAAGATDISNIRMIMRDYLTESGYHARPGEEGTIKDLMTKARLDVILKTNTATARGFIRHAKGMEPGAFAAFPALKLERIRQRKQGRDWAARWKAAGESVGWEGVCRDGGRMVALKDSPIWQALGDGAGGYRDCLGAPYPPFAFGSGMGVLNVSRKDAIALGLISDEELREKTAEMEKQRDAAPRPGMNAGLQATVTTDDVNVDALRAHFGTQFGDLVKVDGNVVKWRAEVLNETLLQGKDFSVDLGVPGTGLLGKLTDNPKTADFAYTLAGKQLTVDQEWRDTKRREGGTHMRHFAHTVGHKRKHPDEVQLTPEDMEMLPTMWRNPDRVIKIGDDMFLTELDAFDGATYIMQVKIEAAKPKLWTFFKTFNPTSMKISRNSKGGTI